MSSGWRGRCAILRSSDPTLRAVGSPKRAPARVQHGRCLGHEDDGGRSVRCGYRGQTPPPGHQLRGDVATVLVQDEGDLGPSTSSGVETSVQAQATLMGAQVPTVGSSLDTGRYGKIIKGTERPIEPPPQGKDYDLYGSSDFFFFHLIWFYMNFPHHGKLCANFLETSCTMLCCVAPLEFSKIASRGLC